MATEGRITYPGICEPLSGLVATVEDGEVCRIVSAGDARATATAVAYGL